MGPCLDHRSRQLAAPPAGAADHRSHRRLDLHRDRLFSRRHLLCVLRDPNARFQSAKELADALREALRGEGAALVGPTRDTSTAETTRSTALGAGPFPIGRVDPAADDVSSAPSSRGSTIAADPMPHGPGATIHAVASTRIGSTDTSPRVPPPPSASGLSGRRAAPVAIAAIVAIALAAGAFALTRSQSSPSAEAESYNIVVTARPLAAQPTVATSTAEEPSMNTTPTPSASALDAASSASPAAAPSVQASPPKTGSTRPAAPETKPAPKVPSTSPPKKPKKDDLLGF